MMFASAVTASYSDVNGKNIFFRQDTPEQFTMIVVYVRSAGLLKRK